MSTLKEDLIRDEGIRLKPYRDEVGRLTIGVGRNLDDMGITYNEAMMMLDHDLAVAEVELIHAKPELMHNESLSHERKDVLINMAFNMGVPKLLKFHKMWEALDKHDYAKASDEMLDSVWSGQVGPRAVRLAKIMKGGQ